MKSDIKSIHDVEKLVDVFYDKVIVDPLISYLFNDVAKIDLPSHLPIMYSFWSSMLLGTGTYKGNPMTAHIQLHKKSPISSEHFDRWKFLFFETIDEFFEGPKADEAKTRVNHMIPLMKFKMEESKKDGFIQ
ncbi:MAG: group III truncated hemoglobin [Bacteroidia bacterium]